MYKKIRISVGAGLLWTRSMRVLWEITRPTLLPKWVRGENGTVYGPQQETTKALYPKLSTRSLGGYSWWPTCETPRDVLRWIRWSDFQIGLGNSASPQSYV